MTRRTNYYFDDCGVYAYSVPALSEAVAPPDNALWTEPPAECPPGHAIVARADRRGWEIVPDHRGTGAFDADGLWRKVERPGPLPEGWSADPPPPSPEDERQAEITALEADLAALDVYGQRANREAVLAILDGRAPSEAALARLRQIELSAGPLRERLAALRAEPTAGK